MIKTFNHISVKQWGLYERTGNPIYLMWFRLPLFFLFKKKIKALQSEARSKLSDEALTESMLADEQHRLKSYFRILYLETLKKAVINILEDGVQFDQWMKEIGKKPSKKFKNLPYYLEQIKEETGIKVESLEDLQFLDDKIDFWVLRYIENFEAKDPDAEEEEETKGMTFMQIARGVFNLLGLGMEFSLSMADFFDFKEQAEKILEDLKKRNNGRNQ